MKNKHRVSAFIKNHRNHIIFVAVILLAILAMIPLGQEYFEDLNTRNETSGISKLSKDYPLNVYFLDVGKADAIVIQYEEYTILIDTGTYDSAEEIDVFLRKLKVKEISRVFLTHPDKDHIGGLYPLYQRYNIDELIYPKVPTDLEPDSEEYALFLQITEDKDIESIEIAKEDSIDTGALKIDILSPFDKAKTTNDLSLVIKLTYKDVSVLFCGDIEKKAENYLLDINADLSADVIKIAHHGSKTSSQKEFLEKVGADYAVISTGHDKNKLPNKSVLKRIENFDMDIYRTDSDGNIHMMTNGDEIIFATEK